MVSVPLRREAALGCAARCPRCWLWRRYRRHRWAIVERVQRLGRSSAGQGKRLDGLSSCRGRVAHPLGVCRDARRGRWAVLARLRSPGGHAVSGRRAGDLLNGSRATGDRSDSCRRFALSRVVANCQAASGIAPARASAWRAWRGRRESGRDPSRLGGRLSPLSSVSSGRKELCRSPRRRLVVRMLGRCVPK